MGEGMVLEFRRPRGPGRAPLIMAAFAVLFGVGQLIDGQSVWLYAPYLVLAVIIVAMAIPSRQPYACVSEESLTLASLLRFTQLRKVVPWSTVSAAWRKEAGLVVLSLTDGKEGYDPPTLRRAGAATRLSRVAVGEAWAVAHRRSGCTRSSLGHAFRPPDVRVGTGWC